MTKQLDPELQLLALACANGVRARINQSMPPLDVAPSIEWTHVVRLARRHGVVALASEGLRDVEMPSRAREGLRQALQQSHVAMLLLKDELLRVVTALQARGIEPLTLKGPALAQKLFGGVGYRSSNDIDLLISPETLQKAQQPLIDLGYELDFFQHTLDERQIRHLQSSTAIHLNLRNHQWQVAVELHWRLFVDRHLLPSHVQTSMRRRSQLVQLGPTSVRTLADEDLLLYLILHGANHVWASLKWLCDVAALVQQAELDWEAWCAWVVRLDLVRPVAQAFTLLRDVMAVPLPAACEALIAADPVAQKLVQTVYDEWNEKAGPLSRLGGVTRLPYRMTLRPNLRHWLTTPMRIWMSPGYWRWWHLPDVLWPINYLCAPFVWLIEHRILKKRPKR